MIKTIKGFYKDLNQVRMESILIFIGLTILVLIATIMGIATSDLYEIYEAIVIVSIIFLILDNL